MRSSLSPYLPSTTIISKLPTHLLAAIYASALPFWHYDDHLCVMKAYNRPPANQIWRIVYEEILRDIHTPRLSVLQACLLYLQKQRAPQDSAAADTPFTWSFLSWTVGLATSLGLHVDCANWDIPAWEKRLRRRLWWAIYSEEKFRSLLVGQPTIIRRDQWDVSSLKDEDFFLDTPPEDITNTGSPPLQELSLGQNVESGLHSRYLAALAQIVDDVYQSLL
jgi:Fungal specific transcription factor domain